MSDKLPLSINNPELIKQWHPTKNGTLTPNQVRAGSHKKVWWKCPKGHDHEWEAIISKRALSNHGCPFCTNKRVSETNSLAFVNPKLSKEWDVLRNGSLTPDQVVSGSHKKIWWICSKNKDHKWQAVIYNRNKGIGCPFCSNKKVNTANSLLITHTSIAKEWHPTKNKDLLPNNVTSGSDKDIWWICMKFKDHVWQAKVYSRTSGSGCPFCSNQKVSKGHSFADLHQILMEEWHKTKNIDLDPYSFTSGSNKKVWWQCNRYVDHEWKVSISARVVKHTGCPFCRNLKVAKSNSLEILMPDLALQWNPTKNGNLTPKEVSIGSHKKVWWICSIDNSHQWEATIDNRVRGGNGCPYCTNRKVDAKRSLIFTHPELIKEWDYIKNEDIAPDQVTSGSEIKIWWVCSKDPTHSWKAIIGNRVKGRGCPYCSQGWTIENIRHFIKSLSEYLNILTSAELYLLFQQNGLFEMQGVGKTFIKAFTTGKFPQEEVEKFINNEPSLVDSFIKDKDFTLEEALEKSPDTIEELDEVTSTDIFNEAKEYEFPTVETKDILKSLDTPVISSSDVEAIEFLIASGIAKIWREALKNDDRAKEQVRQAVETHGGEYLERVRNKFLEEYRGAMNIVLPKGYNFTKEGNVIPPNLMQRLVSYQVKTEKRVGNWSGTGAGKTLSAILSSRVINSKLTIICCPNAVVKGSSETNKGWVENIKDIFPDSIVDYKTLKPNIDQNDNKFHYLVLNYETFQQPDSETLVKQFVDKYKIDFVIIDEIHYSKQRTSEDLSKRRKIINGMLSIASDNNPDIHVLGMSATPVINNLYEGKALLEMIKGVEYLDIKVEPTVNNCMALYQKIATTGIRWKPPYEYQLKIEKPEVDCSEYLDEIKSLGLKHSYVDLEAILTKAKLPEIRKNIKGKTLIYTHFIKDIVDVLKEDIEKDNHKVAFYTGEDKSGLNQLLKGDVDVLIATSAIGTGVDGLQYVCNRLIVNILPWTHAEFEQLKGRIYRQGQVSSTVDIIIPLTFAEINGNRWSWCESKWRRIEYKKDISDAAVDGEVPEGHLRTPAQAYEDVMKWLERLDNEGEQRIERRKIIIPLEEKELVRAIKKFGDFSEMNRRMNTSNSSTTHGRFLKDPTEWELYHLLYREARKDWQVVPYEEMITWCKERPTYVIGDFGCGEAKIAESLENTVYSFDHIAVNNKVIACDMAHVPLEDESLDVAIFSLSLMGINFLDYILEAHRCLKLDGRLFIVEATSRFSKIDDFQKGLQKIGFDIVRVEEKYKFTFIQGIKSKRERSKIILNF